MARIQGNLGTFRDLYDSGISDMKLDSFRVAYVDVDLTLIFWPNDKPILPTDSEETMRAAGAKVNMPLAESLKAWKAADPNRELVIWSANGADHARAAAYMAGLATITAACLTKPQVIVDDNPPWIAKRPWLSPSLF